MNNLAPLALVLAFSSLLYAQQPLGSTFQLGPHSIGGRGCIACHAPHASSSESSRQAVPGYEPREGEVRGIVICLSCHDGTIAKETMLKSVPFEEAAGLRGVGRTSAGNEEIKLFRDAAFYPQDVGLLIDHPVGALATLGAVYPGPRNLNLTLGNNGAVERILLTPRSPEAYFAQNYGFVTLMNGKWGYPASSVSLTPAELSVLCTTCHNPHGASTGGHPSYFFLNGPYNPDAKYDPKTQTSSTTQFCRQCHFDLSNEYNGQFFVKTAF